MSTICPNCKTRLSCGCQRRVASNGASVCTKCLASYEVNLKAKKAIPKNELNPETIHRIDAGISTDPTDLRVTYTPPRF
jgi:hypothetical protein